MVKIDNISKPKLLGLIYKSYEDDFDLFEKYHVQKGDAETLAIKTMEMIEQASAQFPIICYKVMLNKEPIGYFVISREMGLLYSFAINKKYRTKEVLVNWWKYVRMVLGKTFTSVLYSNNTRAISFLKKNGMEVNRTDGDLVTLINYK